MQQTQCRMGHDTSIGIVGCSTNKIPCKRQEIIETRKQDFSQ